MIFVVLLSRFFRSFFNRTLGNLKHKYVWDSRIISVLVVLNSFIKNLFITKSSDLTPVGLVNRSKGSSPYSNIGIHLLFSRSYCYTVWSAIGIILLSVRLSVCLSVCLWRSALWLSGSVYVAKSYTSVLLASMFLFVPFDTFAVGCIV